MLGHIKPPLCRLQPRTQAQYRQLYCSLCYSLRRQFGLPAGFIVSHELTILLLAGADDFAVPLEYRACPARLFCRQRAVIRHEAVDRAARLNLLLVWLKLADWEADSRRFHGGFLRQAVESRVRRFWPDLSSATRDFMEDYLSLTRTLQPDFAVVRENSARLAACLFGELTHRPDRTLVKIVSLVGEIIPVADALLDLRRDIARRHYNPIVAASRQQAIPLVQAYQNLRLDYGNLVHQVGETLAVSEPGRLAEVISKSLLSLSARIDRQGDSGGQSDNRDSRNNKKKKRDRTDHSQSCADGCDCCDCCRCCGHCDTGCCNICKHGEDCCPCGSCHGCEGFCCCDG
jgi:hypothetical protein